MNGNLYCEDREVKLSEPLMRSLAVACVPAKPDQPADVARRPAVVQKHRNFSSGSRQLDGPKHNAFTERLGRALFASRSRIGERRFHRLARQMPNSTGKLASLCTVRFVGGRDVRRDEQFRGVDLIDALALVAAISSAQSAPAVRLQRATSMNEPGWLSPSTLSDPDDRTQAPYQGLEAPSLNSPVRLLIAALPPRLEGVLL
jgi:hypothetical protein